MTRMKYYDNIYLTKQEVDAVETAIDREIANGWKWQATEVITLNHIFYHTDKPENGLVNLMTRAVTFSVNGDIVEDVYSSKITTQED